MMDQIKQIHAHTLRRGIIDQTHLEFLIQRLLQIPNPPYAHSLLTSLFSNPPPTFLSNKLLQHYSLHGPFHQCLSLFSQIQPNPHSFLFLFSACSSSSQPNIGRSLHAQFLKLGHPFDPFVATSLLTMYSKSNSLPSARKLFDELPRKDVACWNAIVSGYTRQGAVDEAKELFEQMPVRNVISWTAMVSGYTQNGRYEEAVGVFVRMWEEGEVRPNAVTLASVLPACAHLGAMGLGVRIEEFARENGLVGNVFVGNALVEMYGKCGSIDRARRVFEEIGERRNLCSWNSMIMGLAVHGRWSEGLELFYDLSARGFTPDDITFVGVLLACTHGGLVDQGRHFFESMERNFSIAPKLEHYGCMVDLLGRAGLLDEAYRLTTSMPMEPDSVIWGALLGACSFHGEVRLAEIAAEFLYKLEPWNSGNLVILANIYASSGRWESVARVWKMMKGKHQRKAAGYSIIELDGRMHKFLVEDKSHPKYDEIYSLLKEMHYLMMKLQVGCAANSVVQMESFE